MRLLNTVSLMNVLLSLRPVGDNFLEELSASRRLHPERIQTDGA